MIEKYRPIFKEGISQNRSKTIQNISKTITNFIQLHKKEAAKAIDPELTIAIDIVDDIWNGILIGMKEANISKSLIDLIKSKLKHKIW